ncbi:MAG: type II secretion system protein [Candidatus Gracilibacteria bacterium]|nr:type II secretion system protein [Candidatus Gracilibacteria bacterium]
MKKAFTLVELIVVITILAILGTIAFINLQGYSTGARDSKRLSDINNIQKKIGIEVSKGTNLSSLINTVKTNAGLTIDNNPATSIQGTANFVNLKENGDSFKDPITGGDYILSYSVGGSGTGAYKFTQVSTVNEENNQAVVKGNYYKMQPSDDSSLIVNEEDFFVVDGGSDLPYEVVAGNNIVVFNPYFSCTGVNTPLPFSATTTYSGCDIPDIIVCAGSGSGYTISACNVGSTIAGMSITSYGNYFQWGRNKGFTYDDTTQQITPIDGNIGLNASTDIYGFVSDINLDFPYSWATDVNSIVNNWGGLNSDYYTSYNDLGENNKNLMQGPCYEGYHISMLSEWVEICNILTPDNCNNFSSSNVDLIKNILFIPNSGMKNYSDGSNLFNDFGSYFWTGIPSNSENPYPVTIESGDSGSFLPGNNEISQANGLSIRCFKN